MKISDLISIPETAKHEHGDVEFCNVSNGVINYDKTPNCCVISVNN